jgi:amino acid adenylation domain-containing protein
VSSHHSTECAIAATGPAGLSSEHDGGSLTPPDCVGPVAIPPYATRSLLELATAAGVADLVPFAACAGILLSRLARRGRLTWPGRACVILGADEVVVQAFPAERTTTFHDVLRRMAVHPAGPTSNALADYPVDVTILVSSDGRRLYVESSTTVSDAPLAWCWARTYLQLLTALATDPGAPVGRHPLIAGAERERIRHGLNRYRAPDIHHATLSGPFEEQCERSPDAIALVAEDGATLTYRQLDERANRLANFLRERGAGPGTRIGVCLQRSIDQIVAIYAAVKSGAAYLPLDADLVDARLAYMLEDATPRHVLADSACRDRIPAGPWAVYDVQADRQAWAGSPATTPIVAGDGRSLLHILYTSGTTGRPKGVAYPTDGALANLFWMQRWYPFRAGDATVFKTSPGFDVSIWEIFWPLYHGAHLVICRPGGHRDPRHLAALVETHAATMISLVPTVMTPFLEQISAARTGPLRWVLCGGEAMTPRIRDKFHATLPGTTLVNVYGPTEGGCVTDMALDPDPGSPVVPLGRPAEHFRLTLLDENLDLVPVGLPGEAYIGGRVGLAHGYWRAPARTAERFVADPYGPPGARMYRTGDLCRYRDDGVLEHLGRIDRQVKVRGQRVEPAEIESVLGAHPAVADCAVLAHGDPVRLLGFVVPGGGIAPDAFDAAAIQAHVATVLPTAMRPERILAVPRIPVTVNEKIDKDALLRVWREAEDRDRDVVPPADDLEARLAEIYGRVLDKSAVSMLDTFTELGGHSLLAFRLLDECREQLHVNPEVADLLAGTVRDVAGSIRAAHRGQPARP